MDTATLKYFIAVAQTQHMSKAAQKLNITQPSLSTSIRRLEADIGYQLFDRTGRGIQLNEYGKIFLEGVTAADHIMSSCLSEMEELKKNSVSFVRMACSNSPTNSQLIDLLLSKGMNLKVDNIPNNWEQELLSQNCDLVITMGNLHHSNIAHAVLRYQKLAVVANKYHPLARAETVTLSDLHRCSFCSTDAPHSLFNVVKEQNPDYDFHPRITFLGRNSSDMLKAIRSGIHVGLMVKRNLPDTEDLVLLPVQDFDVTLPLYLYWRMSDTKKAALASMRQNIIDFYQALPADE
ncbi:LysR family transcriptional regulator [uncultured Clostridium sp.]|uniref:LysR family transcriptional regulator n=1 Tax=uncultured Clostridium sp. TaxID=59620 RepID=UPI0025DFFDF4|nr:LysR family transcriptional regulator [uncultured Clostridium sp.]